MRQILDRYLIELMQIWIVAIQTMIGTKPHHIAALKHIGDVKTIKRFQKR